MYKYRGRRKSYYRQDVAAPVFQIHELRVLETQTRKFVPQSTLSTAIANVKFRKVTSVNCLKIWTYCGAGIWRA